MVAIFTMGIVFPFANQKGAVTGAMTGCLVGWILYAGAKTWPKSDFLMNRIPPEANFDACPADWVTDMQVLLTKSSFNCSTIENRGPRPDYDDYIPPKLDFSQNSDHPCFPENSYHEHYLDEMEILLDSSTIDSFVKFYQYLSHLSYLYLSFFCFIVSMVVGLIVSILTGFFHSLYIRTL